MPSSKPFPPALLPLLLVSGLCTHALVAAAPQPIPDASYPAHCACRCCTLTPSLHTLCVAPPHNVPLPASRACDVIVPDATRGSGPESCSAALCAVHVPSCVAPAFLVHQCVSDRGAVRDVAPVVVAAVALVLCAYVASRQLQTRGSLLAGMPRPPVLSNNTRRNSYGVPVAGDSSDEDGYDFENKPLRRHERTRSQGQSPGTPGSRSHPSRSADGTPLLGQAAAMYDSSMFVSPDQRRHSFDAHSVPQPPRLQLSVTQQARRAASVGVGGAGLHTLGKKPAAAEAAKPHPDISPLGSDLSSEQLNEMHPTCVPSPYS